MVVAHEALPARFDRYIFTAGYNEIINQRQFGVPGLRVADRLPLPRPHLLPTGLSLEVGDLAFELHHARGETDDHTWTWVPEKKVLCSGDLFIWASPNAGNPQKVQRYPREWAVALREMVALGPEVLLPGHGFPVLGADRVRQALTDTADLLDSLVDQTLALMNAGARLDEILHTVAAPAGPAGPALPPTRLRRARIRRPQHLAPLRRLVGRQPRHPETGPRHGPGPGAGRAGRRGHRAWPIGPWPWPSRPPGCPTRPTALRLAAHLAELATLAAPTDPGAHRVRARVFTPVRRSGHLDHGQGRLRLGRAPVRRAGRRTVPEAERPTTTCAARLAKVGAVNAPTTGSTGAAALKRHPRRLALVGAVALPFVLGGCQLPTFWGYRGSTTQAHDEFRLWSGTFIAAIGVGVITGALIIWSIIRYRRRSDEIPRQFQYHFGLEVAYTVIPVIIVLVLFGFTVVTENAVDDIAPHPAVSVDVYAFQWGWQFNYKGQGVSVEGETLTTPTRWD